MKRILFCLAFLLVMPSLVSATDYYISESTGSDGNDGSFNSPWKKLDVIETKPLTTGDKVLLLCGDTWNRNEGDWVYSVEVGNPITIGAYYDDNGNPQEVDIDHPCPGELPLIDGGISSFTQSCSGPWTPALHITSGEVTVQDIKVQNYYNGIYVEGDCDNGIVQRCIVHNVGQSAITLYTGEENGWVIDSNKITFSQQQHYRDKCYAGAIVIRRADNNVVTRNIVGKGYGEGIDVWVGADNNEVAYNFIYEHAGHALYVSTSDNVSVHHNFIMNTPNTTWWYNNVYRGHGLGIGPEMDENGATESSNCTFAYNVVIGCYGGFTVTDPVDDDDASTSTNYIYGNTFIDNEYNLWLWSSDDGELDVTFMNNLFVVNDVANCDHTTGNSLSGQTYTFAGNAWDSSDIGSIGNDFKNDSDAIGDPAIKKGDSWWDDYLDDINIGDAALTSDSDMIDVATELADTFQRMGLDEASSWPDSVLKLDQDAHGDGWEFGAYVYKDPGGCTQDSDCSPLICCAGSCVDPVCSSAQDCDDSDDCTLDNCSNPGTCSASCSYQGITTCTDGDGCCPPGCTGDDDNDCGSGLVAHYTMDSQDIQGGQVLDKSGNNNHATIYGNPQFSIGEISGSLHFDGVDDYLDTGYTSDLPNWTVSVWVRGDSAPGNHQDAGPVMKQENFLVSWDHESSSFREAAGISVGGSWYPASFGTLESGSWYHIAATYDGETLRAFRDGQLITENPEPSGNPDSAAESMKIARHAVNDYFFAGYVDDVRIYSHALSEQEITDLYDSSFHKADTSPRDGCIQDIELNNFIGLWYYDSTAYPMWELMEAVSLYYNPGFWC